MRKGQKLMKMRFIIKCVKTLLEGYVIEKVDAKFLEGFK